MSPRTVHPRVAGRMISHDRRAIFEDEIWRAYLRSVSRRIARRTPLSEVPSLETADFVKLGYNSILDRIPFVDGVFAGVEYAVQGMGYPFGEGLAEGETRFILDALRENVDIKTEGGQSDQFSFELIQRGIGRLNIEGHEPGMILTSVADHLKLWSRPFPRLGDGNPGIPASYAIGRIDIPIIFTRLLAEGTSLVVDPTAGCMTVKQDLTIDFFETFTNEEWARLRLQHPELADSDRSEKLRVLIQEIVRFDVTSTAGYLWLKSEKETGPPSEQQRQQSIGSQTPH